MSTEELRQYAVTATFALRCVNRWRDQRLEKRYNQWRDNVKIISRSTICRYIFERWGMASICRLLPPPLGESSSDDGPGPPPLVSSSSDDQADEQFRRPAVLTDSDTDSDSDSNTVWTPVRNPDGSIELRQVQWRGRRILHYPCSARDSVWPYADLD